MIYSQFNGAGGFRDRWSTLSADRDKPFIDFRQAELPWLVPNTVALFSMSASLWPEKSKIEGVPDPVSQSSMAQIARDFHIRAGTLTQAVQDELEALDANCPTIRVAHQPNFLPSLNVVAQATLVDKLSKLVSGRVAQVFVLIDYDVNTDRRYRHALFPSIGSRSGFHPLSAPALHHRDERVISADMFAADELIEAVLTHVSMYARQDLAILRQRFHNRSASRHSIGQGEELLASYLIESFARGRSLGEANAIFLSKVTNELLRLPTIFLPGHQLLSLLADHFEYLWARSGELSETAIITGERLDALGLHVSRSLIGEPDIAPFWLICEKCDCRLSLAWETSAGMAASTTCPKCRSSYLVKSKDIRTLLNSPDRPLLIPRVVADDLLDGFAWHHLAGCSYRGGLEHYVFSATVARLLGLRPLPEFLSQRSLATTLTGLVPDGYERALAVSGDFKIASSVLSSGRASIAHPIVWQRALDPDVLSNGFLAR